MYPINLILDGRPCAVIGGGHVACQKVVSLLKAAAAVTVIAPDITDELKRLYENKTIQWRKKSYAAGDLTGFALVICASDDASANEEASREATAHHILVNVCDDVDHCTFTSPAVMRQGRLTLTISTDGCSPAFAGWLRRHLEKEYGPVYDQWLQRLAVLRKEGQQAFSTSQERQRFWRSALNDEIMELVRHGKLEEAEAQIRHAISRFRDKL